MSETPPPRDPPEPVEDETVVAGDWPVRPEGQVVVEQTEAETVPRRRMPVIWPALLALLLLVLGGLGAYYFATRDDDDDSPATTATTPTTTAATTGTTTGTTTQAAAPVSVPDVVGTTSSEATSALREVGLEANLVAVPSDRPAGTVLAQNPAAGKEAPEGSTVRLNVAQPATETTPPPATTGPVATAPTVEPSVVPDVVGKELADAAREFGDQGLKVSVQYVPATVPQGQVVAQAQPAGTERRRGDTVQVNISIGPEPSEPAPRAAVPDVVGQTNDQARQALEGAEFEVLALNLETNRVRREDRVVSQTPAAGASIPRGSLVLLYVGT